MRDSVREKKRAAVFFDRDGVVNQSPGAGYVLSWDAFAFSPGLFELLSLVKDRGYLAVLVTSQKGVGKGLMSQRDLDTIHERMQATLSKKVGSGFDAIYAYTGTPDCPHQPKPHPEMILTAAREHEIDLDHSWMIGDADRDIEMGIAAGVQGTIRVRGDKAIETTATETVEDLESARVILLQVLASDSQS